MKKDRLKKMQDKRAENRQKRKSALENKDKSPEQQDSDKQPNQQSSPTEKSIQMTLSISPLDGSLAFAAPRLVFKDGKPVLEDLVPESKPKVNKELTLAEKKAMKTTSMSFKARSHTEKWSPEETKKFLKVRKNV